MIRRVLAQLLIGLVLAGSSPVSEPAAPAARPIWVPAPAVHSAPLLAPPEVAAPPVVSTEISMPSDESTSSAVHLAEGVKIEALPLDVRRFLQAPMAENEADTSLARLRLATDRPAPGIQKDEQNRSAVHSVQEVQPPLAPQAVVAEAPAEYASVTARAEESAPPARPRLTVRPAALRFMLTQNGTLPAAQPLEISSDRREGARFEVAGPSGWLLVQEERGRAGLAGVAVQVALDGRKIAGPLSGLLEVKNLDNPQDVQRIPVQVEPARPGRSLRSFDADGRLQRVVRTDGGILDYEYDPQGRLIRIQRPDGSAVTWSYDEQGHRTAMTDGRGTTVYRYDAQGRLDTLYSPGFEPVRYGYDERSRLTTLTLPGGRVVAWEYDDMDRLLAVRSDLGTTRYAYDAVTRKLSERALPNGIVTHYEYDGADRLTEVAHQDAAGQPLLSFTWSLDAQGRPVSVTRESTIGRETTDLAYDEEGRIVSAAYPNGRVVTYEYDETGRRSRMTETRESAVQVADYLYDDLGRVVRAGDETFDYDAAGDLVRRRAPGQTVEYRWDFEGHLTGFRDGRREVAYELDGDGRRAGMTVDGRTVSFLQDASGWIGDLLVEADADGQILRSHVHGFEPVAVEGMEGEGSFYLYDHPLWAAAALASPTGDLAETFASDPFGAPLARPLEDLPPYLFAGGSYDPITGLIHRDGSEYDPRLGMLLGSRVDEDRSQESPRRWDDAAPQGAFSEALARAFRPDRVPPEDRHDEPSGSSERLHVTVFQFNELPTSSERAPERSRALASSYHVSPKEGAVYRRGAFAAAAARATLATPRLKLHPEYLPFAKTAAGLLPYSQTLEVASTAGQALSFTVTESIPWLAVSAAGGTTPATLTVTVDPAGLTEAGSPYVGDLILTNTGDPSDMRKVRARLAVRATGASVTLRSFDANGNLRRVIKPDGAVIDYEADALGRVIHIRYPDQPAVTYAYDGNGNRVSMTDQRGTTIYQYDRENRLTAVLTPRGANFIAVHYGYDKAGRLTSLATPDGRTVLYQYDADGRMTRVTDGADITAYTYNTTTGLLASQTLPNGITTTYTYDADGRLTDVMHKTFGNALLMGFHYTLNALGQRTSVTKQTPAGSELTSYTYDALGRLASVTYPGGKTVSYTYDRLGNRLSMTTVQGGNTTVVNYEYDKDNRLLKAGDEVFQYDANGNMIRRASPAGTTTYAYDARNLLTRVETGTRVVTFEYNGDGNRIAKEADGARTNFVNDAGGLLTQVLIEASASWQVLRSYGYGVQRIGQSSVSAARYYLFNGKDVALLTDGAGSLKEIYSYDEFGLPAGNIGENAVLFGGEFFDVETSLIYLRARYYDPALGRFLSRDPVTGSAEGPGTYNPYAFVSGDPVNRIDPTGLVDWPRVGKASLELVGAGLAAAGGAVLATGGVAAEIGSVGAATPVAAPMGLAGAGLINLGALGLVTGTAELLLAFKDDGGSMPGDGNPVGFLGYVGSTIFGYDDVVSRDFANDVAFVSSAWSVGKGLFEAPTALNTFSTTLDAIGVGWDLLDFNEPSIQSPFLYDGLAPNLQSGFSSYASYLRLDLGGVSLNKTAELLLSVQDVTGATFDESTGQLVLLGKENVALPPLEMDHVAVAVQSVYGGQDPGVSIDPPIVNHQMSVRYEGQTRDTRFGDIMFEADRVLKILTLGKDNLTGQSVGSSVPGYKNMLRRRLDAGCRTMPTSTRMWFQPKEVRLVPSTDGRSMVFDAVSMELLYESKVGNKIVSDPQAAAFAAHFTQNYAALANEWPILKKLEQLGKVVAIIKWIKDNKIPIDLSFLDNHPIEFFSTAASTPTVTVQGTKVTGPLTCTVTLQGGVTYDVPNQYLTADPAAGAALNEALARRPSEESFRWTYQPGSSSGPVTAVAESLTRSRRDGNVRFQEVDLSDPLPGGGQLSFLRTYNSFLDRTGPLGAGWSILPVELRFPLKKERFTFGSANLALDLYARIWLAERVAGREDAYDLLGVDSSNFPIYRRADAMHVLRQQTDGSFLLTREDGSTAAFRADGKPASLVDRNGNAVSFVHDAQTRLIRLEGGGRTITLVYDGQGKLTEASGSGGRQIVYGYAQGRLATVTDFADRSRTYGYDANGRLTSATDAEGRTVFSAAYDDYDRSPSRRLGAAAQYGFDFDLGTGQSTMTDPFGRTARQIFERRQLASPSGIRNEVYRPRETEDPLGNRTAVDWADDAFGPRVVTDAQGAATELAWDNRGHLTAVQDALGGQTERFYDWRDRLVAVRDPEGLATAFGYDDKKNPTIIYHDVSLTLDANGDLSSFSYNPANLSTFAYDAAGNLAAAANQLGQQTQVQNNASGQPARVTSPAGLVSTMVYDARSRMTSSQAAGRQTTYGYDEADQISSVTTAGRTTSFDRDLQGRVTRLTDALSRSTHFSYDTDGRLTQVEDALAGVATYAYDVLGHLLSASLPNGTSNAWEYDELGRPVASLTGLGPAAPRMAVRAESLDFGTVGVGSSRQLPFDLYNLGTAPLTVSGITVSAPFSVVFSGPATIQPAGSLQITVTFTPIDQVPASANLSITSDDPETPLVLVELSGEGSRKITGLTATGTQEGIHLNWNSFNPGSRPFGHFNSYRSLTPIPDDVTGLTPFDTSLTNATAVSFLDKLATPGISYYYAVTPVYANGYENKSVDPAGPVAYFTTFGPLAGDLALATAAQSENHPAISYNSTANEYLVVYERSVSASNTDIYGQRVSVTGALVGSPIVLANSTRNERRPRLAYNPNSNNYLAIWEYDQNGSNFDLQLRTASATGSLGGIVTLGSSALRQDLAPEIAFGSTSQEYLVAYETDGDGDGKTDLSLLRLSATGANLGATSFRIPGAAGGFVHATNPHLAYNSTLNEFMVAFERDAAGNGSNIEIWRARFKPDLTLVLGQIFPLAQAVGHDRNPYLTYDSFHNEYLAVWEVDATGTGIDLDIKGSKLNSTGAGNGIAWGSQAQNERNPRAVYNRNLDDFVIVWEEVGSPLTVRAQRIHFTFTTLQIRTPVDVTSGTASRLRPDVGTSTQANSFLAVWEQEAGSGNFDVRSRLLGTFTPTLQVSPLSLSFSGATTHQTLTITNGNPSGGALQWTAVANQPWMTAQPGFGSTTSSMAVDIGVDRTELAPGTYSGTVAVNSNNGSSNVAVTLIVGNTPPDTPNSPRPADGATDQASVSGGTDLTLGWQGGDADGDSVTWAVYLSTNSAQVTARDPAVRIGQGLANPSLQPAGLTFLCQYFWRVEAFDARGGSTAGPVWRFTTAAVPPPVLLPVTPDPTRETRPVLSWQSMAGAASYHLQVADNPGFSPRLLDQTGIAATSFTPAAPLLQGTIYWRVRSLDAAGQPGLFSAPDSFVIDVTAAGVPTLVPVTPDPTNISQPELSWSTVSGAASYRVQMAETPGFTDPIVDATVSTTSYQPSADLPEGAIYWRVASLDEAGNQSAFSGVDHFALDVTPPPSITGLTAQRNGGSIGLTWEPLASPPADFVRFRIYRAEAPFTNVTGVTLLNESLTSSAALSFQDATASAGVAYWYAVTAVDTAGNEDREVTTAQILANEPPAEPALVAPAGGVQVLPSGAMAVPLAWSASDPENDPLRFEVFLSTDLAQVEGALDITARIAEDLETPAFAAPDLSYQKTYHWRVAALDLASDGTVRSATFGPVWSFSIPAIPAPMLTPLTPDPTQQPRPTFTWQAVPGAAGYRIEIASDAAFTLILAAAETEETSWAPSADLPDGTLRWHVRAIDAQGLPGVFSAPDEFVLDATPLAVPVLVAVTPDPTSNRRPSFSWGTVTDASSYRVEISGASDFASPLVDTTVSTASYQPASDLPEGRIYWRVASVDAVGNQSAFPAPDDFLVDVTAPAVPVLVAVTPDPTSNRRPSLSWGAVTDASSYRVQIASAPSFAVPLVDTMVSTASYQPASDLPEGRIYLRVASVDAVGNQSAFSAPDDFLVDVTAPAVPLLVAVTPDPTSNRRPSFSWGVVTDVSSYRVQISSALDFGAPLVDTTVSTASYQPVSDLPEGRIYWRVASMDEVGNQSAFCATDDFLLDVTAPAVPVLVAVTPDPTSNRRPSFSWGVVTDVSSYRVQISSAPGFAAPLVDTTVSTASYQPASDLPEGRIYWRVASMDAVGNQSAFSAPDDFQVDVTAPAVPVLVAVTPDPTSNRRPSFSWGTVPDASSYHVQISSAPGFAAPLVDTTVSTASYQPVSDLPEGRIYWRVASMDAVGNQSSFSSADDFLVSVAPPAVPVLVAVTPDPTNNRRPGLSWGVVAGASSYRVQVSSTPSFATLLVDTTVSAASYQPTSDLPEGRVYWRVASRDSAGNQSAFSTADDFLVDITPPPVPSLLAVSPDPTSNRRLLLGWSALVDVLHYRIQISSAPSFAAPLVDTVVSINTYQPSFDLPEGRIYWRVASLDTVGNQSTFSVADDFLIDLAVSEVPVLVPVTPDPTSNRRPGLSWGAVAGIPVYRVQIASTPSFTALLVNATVSTASYQPASDLPEGRIYWRVASIYAVGDQSAFSAPDDFLVDVTPPAVPVPVALTPDPTNNRRPNLGWGAVADAPTYRVQVSSVPNFSSLLANWAVSTNFYQPTFDLPEGQIYWRVASVDSAGNQSAFSAADDFVVDATPPAVPWLVPVTPDPTSNPRPLLGWSAIVDVTYYQVQVSTVPNFATLLVETIVSLNTYRPGFDLPEGRIYWRAASRDTIGNQSAFSTASSFNVDRTPPPAITGLVADWDDPGTRLVWDAMPGSVTDVAQIRVFRSSNPFTNTTGATLLATLGNPLATSFVDTFVPHGVVHHYAVTAVDRAGNELTAVTSVATPPPGGDMYTVAPCRVLDTRNPAGPFGGPALVALQPRSFAVASLCGIPATARAIIANLTVVSATAAGYVKAYPGGIPSPLSSAIHFPVGAVRANSGIFGLQDSGSGILILEADMPAGATAHVVLDVAGYFE